MPENSISPNSSLLRSLLYLALGILCVVGFYDVGAGYGDYAIAYGRGDVYIHSNELIMYVWYLTFGIPAAFFLSLALLHTQWPERLERWGSFLIEHKYWLLGALAFLFVAVLLFWWGVLMAGARIADDESTYLFIAQTLNMGRVTNPLPTDPEFYRNKFVLMKSSGWFGKYPIGFPALLAVGYRLNLTFLINPLLTCASLALTYAIGTRLFSRTVAGLGVVFMLFSPHFVFTGATLLSQPASTAMMLLGFYIMLRVYDEPKWTWALAGGVAWGFGVLIRPFPGILFLAVAALHYLWVMHQRGWKGQVWSRLKPLVLAAIPVAIFGVLFLSANHIQSGSATTSGYHQVHRSFGIVRAAKGVMTSSIGGALFRENFWLFGWPLSFLFVFFCRRGQHLALFWGLILADYSYRIIVPKTVVATTGPIYVTEAVPLLCLATAAGIVALGSWCVERGWEEGKRWLLSLSVASTLVALCTFYPIHIQSIQESCEIWNRPFQMLQDANAKKKVLVFANYMVPHTFDDSWAYHPPNPSPTLDDDILFVRLPKPKSTRERMKKFWKKNHPKRQAWLFFYVKRKPYLIKIGDP